MNRNIIGPRVKQAREKAEPRVTQGELSARLQVLGLKMNQGMVSKIEQQRRPVYDYELRAFAEALHVSLQWLLEGEEPKMR
jgi:hypothetical protein